MLKVNEIFTSIEGEGQGAGYLTTFVRLYGCNLACLYCDTEYACHGNDYDLMSILDIVECVEELGVTRVTVTGGEPLLHDDSIILLLHELIDRGHLVNVETNGSFNVAEIRKHFTDNSMAKLRFTIDFKCESSNMTYQMDDKNFENLFFMDTVKFVVGSEDDLLQMKEMIEYYGMADLNSIYVSPVWGKIELETIADFLKDNMLENVRMQVQLHKLIWDVDKRGV